MKVKIERTVSEEFMTINPPCYFQRNDTFCKIFIRVYQEEDRLYFDQLLQQGDNQQFANGLPLTSIPEDVIPVTREIWEEKLGMFLDFIINLYQVPRTHFYSFQDGCEFGAVRGPGLFKTPEL